MSKLVYLYGPIVGKSYEGATLWRDWMKAELAQHGIEALSPMRAHEFLQGCKDISAHGRDYAKSAVGSPAAVLARDKYDVRRVDMLVGNFLGADRVGLGSMFEQAWAHMLHKPIAVAVEPQGNPHDHIFFNETVDFRVESLEALRDVVLAVLG